MKRATVRIVLFLFLGSIISVSVAWGCAYWIDRTIEVPPMSMTNYGFWRDDQSFYHAVVYRRHGRVVAILSQSRFEPFPAQDGLARWPSQPMEKGEPPTWSAVAAVFRTRQPQPQLPPNVWQEGWWYRMDLGLGWPCAAMGYRIDFDSGFDVAQLSYRFTGSLAGYSMFETGELPRVLPLRPIWRGFVFNTIFYAVILSVLCYAPAKLRRSVRARRGMCPVCAYDLRHADHAVCPECSRPT